METPSLATLAAFVTEHRERMGITQTELARRADLSKSELNAIEKGRVGLPGADKRRRLAEALGVSHQALLVAAGELTAEEVGTGWLAYRPPFAEDDPRADVVDGIRSFSASDARLVLGLIRAIKREHERTMVAAIAGEAHP